MKADILLGLQWGDEGKGKIVDVLTPKYDLIARFQGGPNAGHTLEFNGKKHVLHTIPSGIFRDGILNLIGNGVVIDPAIFMNEIKEINATGVDIYSKLFISRKAHLILPSHRVLDAASEAMKGKSKIGSTLKGIGPTYMDKTGRNGLRIGDIELPDFIQRYQALTEKHLKLLQMYDFSFNLAEYEKGWFEGIEYIRKFKLVESEQLVNQYLRDGKRILAEGAQGTLLDIDFGSYPFVTSSNTVCAGACTGLGLAPSKVGEVFGIVKAYCTRVGSGPFPTELFDQTGEDLRRLGNEFGSTTGRARRCGWLDIPALKYSVMINGTTQLVITKADVLNTFAKIKIATHYKIGNEIVDYLPYDLQQAIEPVYKEFDGWQQDICKIRKYSDLPTAILNYLSYIEEQLNVPVSFVSVGPDREAMIQR